MVKTKVIYLAGPVGSGKTTVARELAKQFPDLQLLIVDRIREVYAALLSMEVSGQLSHFNINRWNWWEVHLLSAGPKAASTSRRMAAAISEWTAIDCEFRDRFTRDCVVGPSSPVLIEGEQLTLPCIFELFQSALRLLLGTTSADEHVVVIWPEEEELWKMIQTRGRPTWSRQQCKRYWEFYRDHYKKHFYDKDRKKYGFETYCRSNSLDIQEVTHPDQALEKIKCLLGAA